MRIGPFGSFHIVMVVAFAMFFSVLAWVLINKEYPSDKLKTVCAHETSPSRITQVRRTYFYTCPDGSTGWVD